MEFPLTGQIIGTALFFVGTWILSYCSKVEKEDKDRLKKIKYRQTRYQDRRAKGLGKEAFQLRGTVFSLGGYSVAMAGIITFIMTTTWVSGA